MVNGSSSSEKYGSVDRSVEREGNSSLAVANGIEIECSL